MSRVGNLRGEVAEVGAGAAALAALDYLPYDKNDKLSFAVGTGTYKSQTAVALGAKYYANRDVAINAGTTIGNGDEMWNVGVSFRFGSGSDVEAERLTPEQEQSLVQTVMALAEKVKAQDAEIASLKSSQAEAQDDSENEEETPAAVNA